MTDSLVIVDFLQGAVHAFDPKQGSLGSVLLSVPHGPLLVGSQTVQVL